jgi:hypothetical protein
MNPMLFSSKQLKTKGTCESRTSDFWSAVITAKPALMTLMLLHG